MGSDKGKQSRSLAEEERVRSQQLAEEERLRGQELFEQAQVVGERLPEEKEALTRGTDLLQQITGLALDPEQFISRLDPTIQRLTTGLGTRISEEAIPFFQRRGIAKSGIFAGATAKALARQAADISRLVLQSAPQFLGLGATTAGGLASLGQQARARQQEIGFGGLQLRAGSEARGTGLTQTGLREAGATTRTGLQQAGQPIQMLGQVGGQIAGAALTSILAPPPVAPNLIFGGGGGLASPSQLLQAQNVPQFGGAGQSLGFFEQPFQQRFGL